MIIPWLVNMTQARCFTNQDFNINCVGFDNPASEDDNDMSMQNLLDIIKEAYKVDSDCESECSEIDWDLLNDNDLLDKMASGLSKDLLSEETSENLKLPCTQSENLIVNMMGGGEDQGISEAKSLTTRLLEEGIMDAALSCMVPALAKRAHSTSDQTLVNKSNNISRKIFSPHRIYKIPSKDRQKPEEKIETASSEEKISKEIKVIKKRPSSPDVEVEIHVCDEVKNVKKNFTCSQRLLVSKMGYFAEVTTGQRLEDMDISVHCDVAIFEWLMRWIKKDITPDDPKIDSSNVIPIMISASFLQMEPLLDESLKFLQQRMSDVLQTNANFSCINDLLLTRLAALFSNRELEQIRDRKDRIQSRLYSRLIISLADPCRENNRGHWTSLSSLFQCQECQKLLIRETAEWVPCCPGRMRLDRFGEVRSYHVRDPKWFLNSHIKYVRDHFRGNWRKVYWRLWAECHWLRCRNCQTWYPCREAKHCLHHPEQAQFVSADIGNSALVNIAYRPFPVGRFPCCNQKAFRFHPVHQITGCQFREHLPELTTEKDEAIYKLYKDFEILITSEPPPVNLQPDRLSRLTPYKDAKDIPEIIHWQGMALAPSKSKAGLLYRFWEKQNISTNQIVKKTLEKSSVHDIRSGEGEEDESITSTLSDASSSEVGDWSTTYSDDTSDSDGPDEEGTGNFGEEEENEPRTNEIQRNKRQESRHTLFSTPVPSRNGVDKRICIKTTPTNLRSVSHSKPQNKPNKIIKKKRRKRRTGAQTHWMATASTRANQDRQRELEERLMSRISLELIQKTCLSRNNNSRHSHEFGKSTWGPLIIPPGGTYVRLEQAWRESRGLGNGFRPSKTMGWLGARRARTAR